MNVCSNGACWASSGDSEPPDDAQAKTLFVLKRDAVFLQFASRVAKQEGWRVVHVEFADHLLDQVSAQAGDCAIVMDLDDPSGMPMWVLQLIAAREMNVPVLIAELAPPVRSLAADFLLEEIDSGMIQIVAPDLSEVQFRNCLRSIREKM